MKCLNIGLQAMQRPRVQDDVFSQHSLRLWFPSALSVRILQDGVGYLAGARYIILSWLNVKHRTHP